MRTNNAQEFLYTGNPSAICDDGVTYVLWDRDLTLLAQGQISPRIIPHIKD